MVPHDGVTHRSFVRSVEDLEGTGTGEILSQLTNVRGENIGGSVELS
jgi:hypothetical protein